MSRPPERKRPRQRSLGQVAYEGYYGLGDMWTNTGPVTKGLWNRTARAVARTVVRRQRTERTTERRTERRTGK